MTTSDDYESLGCLNDMFERQANTSPEKIAVVCDDGRTVTYRQLLAHTKDLASLLQNQFGVSVNKNVGILMEKSLEYVISYIAILRAGGAYIPLDISYPEILVEDIVAEVKPSVVLTKKEYEHKILNAGSTYLTVDQHFLDTLQQKSKNYVFKKSNQFLDSPAYIVYSSGTTGKPKGIQCPHRGAVYSYNWRHNAYPYGTDEREACNVFFVWEMMRPLLKGATLYVIPDDVIYDPTALCDYIARNKITRMLFTPSLIEAVLDSQQVEKLGQLLHSFRLVLLCGEVVTVKLLGRLIEVIPESSIVNLYSISECHDVAAVNLVDWYKVHRAMGLSGTNETKFAPVGSLLPDVKVGIFDENFIEQPIGAPGEIYVGGPTLAIGYVNRPELNEKKFNKLTVPKLITKYGEKVYKTGDWGYLLPNGSLEICGRCDSMVKVRGYSIEIQAIENVLLQMSQVSSCAVIAHGQEGTDKFIIAYVVRRTEISRKDLRAILKRRLPFYMIPSYFIFLEKLPLLPAASKIDKKALPSIESLSGMDEVCALPQTPTETVLTEIWRSVLNIKFGPIDTQESFFDLGGHSLLASRMLLETRQHFSIGFAVAELFKYPTISDMSLLIDKRMTGSDVDTDLSDEKSKTLDMHAEIKKHDLKFTVMDLTLRAFWRSFRWNRRWREGCVLLTGATGYLGSNLFIDLLLTTELSIVCLIRGDSAEGAKSRLLEAISKQTIFTLDLEKTINSRVHVMPGDVALHQLGLSDEEYHYLSYDIDIVIHAAAYVNLIYPYEALHGANVLGTQNVLMFSFYNKIKPLHYISTDAVFPNNLTNVDESTEVVDLTEIRGGYSQSKFVAENLVISAEKQGLPTIIYRLGNQGGHTKSGKWNPQDLTYLMIHGICETMKIPDVTWELELTPIDFTCKVITELVTKKFASFVGQKIHLISENNPSLGDVKSWLSDSGYDLQSVGFNSWKESLVKTSANSTGKNDTIRYLLRLLDGSYLQENNFSKSSTFNRVSTNDVLKELGLSYPVLDKTLFQFCVNSLVKQNMIRSPKPGANQLKNKVCIVTGASSGIGAAIASKLALEGGVKVVICSRNMDKLQSIEQGITQQGGECYSIKCDITYRNQVQRVIDETIFKYSKIDILINNAGVMYFTLLKNLNENQWNEQIDINCKGTMNFIAASLPHMIKNNCGHIVNITSDAGRRGFPGLAVYSGTKFFIEGMASAMRQELIEHNIKVTNVQPGDVSTGLHTKSTDMEASQKYDESSNHKILIPDDIARSVLFAVQQPYNCAINEILVEPISAPI